MLNYGGYGLGLIFQAKDLATKTMNQVERNLRSLSQSADEAGRQWAASMRAFKTGIAGLAAGGAIAAPLALAGTAAFNSAAQFEVWDMQFTTLLGSAEKARGVLADLGRFADITPFEEEDIIEAGRLLRTFSLDYEQYLQSAGDLASQFGADGQTLLEVIGGLGRMKAGQFGEAFETFRRFGISYEDWEKAGLRFNESNKQFLGTAEEALEAFGKVVQMKGFAGGMEKLSQTAPGILSNIRGAWGRFMRGIGLGFYDTAKDALSGVLGMFTSIDPQKVGQAIGQGFRDLLGVLVPVFKVLVGVTGAVARFVQARPKVASFIITLTGISAAVLILAGGFLVVKGVLNALPLLLQRVGVSANLSLGHLLWPVLLVTAAFYALRYAYEKNLGGFADFVNRLALLWRGVVALVSSTKFTPEGGWTGLLPEDLRNKLKESGLLDMAVDIWRFTVRVRNFFSGLAAGASTAFAAIEAVVKPIGQVIFTVLRVVGQVLEWLGVRFARAGDAAPIKQWETAGRVAGIMLVPILALVGAAKAIAVTRAVLKLGVKGLGEVQDAFKTVVGLPRAVARGIANFGAELGSSAARLRQFDARAAVRGIANFGANLGSSAARLRQYVRNLQNVNLAAWGARFKGNIMGALNSVKQFGTILKFTGAQTWNFVRSLAGTGWQTAKQFGTMLKFTGAQVWSFIQALAAAIWQTVVFGAKMLWAGLRAAGSFIASLIRTGITALVSFVPQIGAATSAAWAFTAALLANPITWVIAAVLALGAAIYLLWRNWDRVVKFITGAWAKYKKVIIAVLAPLPITWIIAPIILVGRYIYSLVKNWGAVRASLVGGWQRVVQAFRVGVAAIGQFFRPLIVFFTGFWNALRGGPRAFFAWLVAAARQIGSLLLLQFRLIGNAVRGTASSITGWLSRPLKWIQNAFTAVWDRIGLVVSRAVTVIVAPFRWLARWLGALFRVIFSFFTGFWGALKLGPSGFMKWLAGMSLQFGRLFLMPLLLLGTALSNLWGRFAGSLANIWQGIIGWLGRIGQAIWQWITQFPAQVWSGITQAFNTLISSLPGWLQQIADFFLGLPAQAIEWGKNLIGGFVEGVKDALGNLGNIAKTAAASVKKFLGLQSPAEAGPLSTADKWAPRLAEMFAAGLRRGVPLVSAASVTLASALSTGIAAAEIPTVRVPVAAPITVMGLSATRADREQPMAPAPVIPAGQARQVPPLLVRPLVPHETVKARETPAAQKGPDVLHLVVELDGRVIYETWRRYDLEEKDRSAPW